MKEASHATGDDLKTYRVVVDYLVRLEVGALCDVSRTPIIAFGIRC